MGRLVILQGPFSFENSIAFIKYIGYVAATCLYRKSDLSTTIKKYIYISIPPERGHIKSKAEDVV